MMQPYYSDGTVSLYVGDMRDVLPALDVTADLIVSDPPYGETSLKWDRWPDGWVKVATDVARSMWCFGSIRMFLQHAAEFADAGWKLSQDVIWEKHNGSGFQNDRFKRVHESALHWYRGAWSEQHRAVPVTHDAVRHRMRRNARPPHMNETGTSTYLVEDGGPRLMRSVMQARSMHGRALHPTEKPIGILTPLIEYGCPIGGTVLDPFAGSGSTLEAARLSGRRAIGVEADEKYAERAAVRLSQAPLDFGEVPG